MATLVDLKKIPDEFWKTVNPDASVAEVAVAWQNWQRRPNK